MFNNKFILILIFILNFYFIKSTTILNSNILEDSTSNHNENHTKSGLQENEEDIAALESKKALELYKLIMIFTCCILAILLVCFLICILKNSDTITTTNITNSQLNLNDAFSSSDENSINTHNSNSILINIPFDKPPTYFESLQASIKEYGTPPPIYTINPDNSINQQLFNQQQNQRINQDELILDCNRLVIANDERSNLELIIANQNREQLRRLSRDLERCYLPNPLNRSHSTPVICLPPIIRKNLLTKNQHLINLMQSPNNLNSINRNTSSTNLINNSIQSSQLNNELNTLNELRVIHDQIINQLTNQQTNLEQNNLNKDLI